MNTIFLLLFLTFCTLLVVYLYNRVNTGKTANLKELYSEGLDMLVSGKRYAAYNNFKQIIKQNSNNIMAYIRLGQVLRENGNYVKAIKIHKSILLRKKLSSYETIELHKNLSKDYFKIENYKQAINECKKIIDIDSNNEWALKEIIRLYKNINDWENAFIYLKQYFEIFGKIDNKKLALYKVYQAKYQLLSNDFIKSKNTLEEALSYNKEEPLIYYFLAKANSEESNVKYDEALLIEKDDLNKYDNKDKYNECIKEAKEILAKSIPLWTHFCEINPKYSWLALPLIKDALFALDRYSEMETTLIALNKRYPDNIEILINLADYYSHKGEIDSSIEYIDMAIEKDDKAYLSKLIKIKLLSEKSNNAELSKSLEELITSLTKNDRFQVLNNSNINNDYKALFDLNE